MMIMTAAFNKPLCFADDPSQTVHPTTGQTRHEMFETVQGIIYKMASSWQKRMGGELEDLQQEAAICALNAIEKWNPEHSKLSTYVYNIVYLRTGNYQRKRFRQEKAAYTRHEIQDTDRTVPDSHVRWMEEVDELTPKASEILEFVLEMPETVHEKIKSRGGSFQTQCYRVVQDECIMRSMVEDTAEFKACWEEIKGLVA
jgi:RNA polymerase sigma factor (sigma-70 family)